MTSPCNSWQSRSRVAPRFCWERVASRLGFGVPAGARKLRVNAVRQSSRIALALLAVAGAHIAKGEELPPGLELVTLHNGLNEIDLDSDGKKEPVMVAHRANYNAHSSDVTTIYLWTHAEGEGPESKGELQIVPRATDGPFELLLKTSGGADGLLNDFRLLLDREHHSAVLITAEREFGSSYADSRPVQFQLYQLAFNENAVAGFPTAYFRRGKAFTSQKPYQDVGVAFEGELKLGAGMRAAEQKP